jgi:hypothetical protein
MFSIFRTMKVMTSSLANVVESMSEYIIRKSPSLKLTLLSQVF